MKKITLLAAVCTLSLGACDTLNSISMPSFGKSNSAQETSEGSLESIADQAEKNIQKTSAEISTPAAIVPTSALETELSEMEKLTGTRIQAKKITADVPTSPVMDEKVADTVTELLNSPVETVAEITEDIAIVEENAPTAETIEVAAEVASEVKHVPTAPALETIEKVEPAIEAAETTETIKVAKTTAQPEPVKPVESQGMPEPVTIKTPKAVAPTVTEETPIFTESDLKLSSAEGCPRIQIMPAARSITYLENDEPGQTIARASISEIRGGCEVVSGGMELDLDILMKGTITNKGRFEGNVDEEAFMTFPYFVSVSTPQGLPVDKQILATAMRFRPSVDYLDHAEKITQFIPIRNVAEAANYTITVGYQLTRKQLDYNRAVAAARPNDRRASPDTIPARRLSVNPLAK